MGPRCLALAIVLALAVVAPAAADPAPAAQVYVYDRGGLSGLYCTTPSGLARGTACTWSARLNVPVGGKRIALARRTVKRELLDGSVVRVDAYRLPRGRRAIPVVVIETRAGLTVLAGPLTPERGPNAEALPLDALAPVLDRSGVTRLPLPTSSRSRPPPPVRTELTLGGRTLTFHDLLGAVPLAALDLDGDGVTELIVLTADDGGSRVEVVEVNDDEARFRADVGG